jgi:hypothetical protein
MREDAKKHGCPEPKFTANGFFTSTFRPSTAQVPRKYPACAPASCGSASGGNSKAEIAGRTADGCRNQRP